MTAARTAAFSYVQTDIPSDMTIAEYRRSRPSGQRGVRRRLASRLGRLGRR